MAAVSRAAAAADAVAAPPEEELAALLPRPLAPPPDSEVAARPPRPLAPPLRIRLPQGGEQTPSPNSPPALRRPPPPPPRPSGGGGVLAPSTARRLLGEASVEGWAELSPRSTDTRADAAGAPSPLCGRSTPPPTSVSSSSLSSLRSRWRGVSGLAPPLRHLSPPLPQAQPPLLPSLVAGLHVLVVDDERSHRRIAVRMLERLGCTSSELEDGEDLMRALVLSPRKVDAVLLDIVMVRSNGLAVVRDLRAHKLDDLPVVAATAYHSRDDDGTFARAGFNDVLDKPFTQRQLEQTLNRAMLGRGRFRAGPPSLRTPANKLASSSTPAGAEPAATTSAPAESPRS